MPEEIVLVATPAIAPAPVHTPAAAPVVDSASSATLTTEARTALEAKVEASLAVAMGEEPEVAEEAPKTTEEIAKEAVEAAGLEKTNEEEIVDEQAKDAEEAAAAATVTATETPTLPAAYVRALKSDEWTDEEIARSSKDPTFLATAAKIYQRRNAETAKWAEAGRALRKEAPAPTTVLANQVPLLDVKALKEQYGDDKLIDSIVGPANAQAQQINAILPIVQMLYQQQQSSQVETLSREINGFFGSKELEPFKDLYGTASAVLSNDQKVTRNNVLEYADALMAGARVQGRSLAFSEAMTIAHDAVSGDYQKQAVRTQLTTTLQKRNKGITLRSSAKTPIKGGTVTRGDMEKNVASKLAAVFG